MTDANPWQLYATMAGCEDVAARLDAALAAAIHKLDRMVSDGSGIGPATQAAFRDVDEIMAAPELSAFGASDSEPREHLAIKLQRHARAVYGVRLHVDRWGDVSDR